MTSINRPVTWNAQAGTVTGEATKRGHAMLTVALASGKTIVCRETAVEYRDVEKFAPATNRVSFTRADRDYYGDARRMRNYSNVKA